MYILAFYLQLVPVSQLARDKFEKYFSCYCDSATSMLFDKYSSKYYRKLAFIGHHGAWHRYLTSQFHFS